MWDFIYKNKAVGTVAQRLLANGMNPMALRPYLEDSGEPMVSGLQSGQAIAHPTANATLRKDEWKHYDTAILKAALQRLRITSFLESKGLVYNIPNGMAATVLEYEDMSDMEAAGISMDAVTRGDRDRPEFDINYLPLPIVHKDFTLNIRALNASRTTGAPLDTTMAEAAARKVAEKIEEMILTGASAYAFGGGTLRGLLDFPNANSVTLEAHWDDSAADGETMLSDTLSMKQASINARHYGPWVLLIPTGFETAVDEDFKSNSDKSARSRLLEVSGVEDIIVCDLLTADNIVLLELTAETFRLVKGMGVTVVEWETEGGLVVHYKVMAIIVPQPRADQDDRCGITVGTK